MVWLQSIFNSAEVIQVNVPAATGDMGILANHVPTIEPLRAGVVEVLEQGNASKKWFGSSFFLLFSQIYSLISLYSLRRICDCSPQQLPHNQRCGGCPA